MAKNQRLLEQFLAAQTDEEKFAICAGFCKLHMDAREKSVGKSHYDDVEDNYKLDKILDGVGLRQMVCVDANQPDVYWRFVAKVLEAIPEWIEEKGLTEWVANLRKGVY